MTYKTLAARVAYVVYNDVYSDTRVLKIADTAARAGAEVRIFAFASRSGNHRAGLEVRPSGVEISRLPLREIRHILPLVVSRVRAILPSGTRGRFGRGELTDAPSTTSGSDSVVADTPTTAPSGRPARFVVDAWRRADLTLRMVSFWMAVKPRIVEWNPDLIHAHDANTLVPARVAARRLNVPYLYDSHELWLHRNVAPDRPIAKFVDRLVESWGIRRAAEVVTVSPSISKWLHSHYRLRSEPVLLRNLPYSQDDAQATRGRLHEMAALADDIRIVAYCGGIATGRGLEETVAALPYLDPDSHLVVLGYGSADLVVKLRKIADENGSGNRVHFVGAVQPSDVSSTLADADVGIVLIRPICLSYRYSLPNKLFESVHAGIPIVASALPDMEGIVLSYDLGAVIDPSATPEQLAQTLETVMKDGDRYRSAARRAAPELAWEAESKRLTNMYLRLIGTGFRKGRRP